MMAERASAFSAMGVRTEALADAGTKIEGIGLHVARYALVLVLVWIGAMKFTAYEAGAIQPLVANSPLMSWLYAVFSVQVNADLGTSTICTPSNLPRAAAPPVSVTFMASGTVRNVHCDMPTGGTSATSTSRQ